MPRPSSNRHPLTTHTSSGDVYTEHPAPPGPEQSPSTVQATRHPNARRRRRDAGRTPEYVAQLESAVIRARGMVASGESELDALRAENRALRSRLESAVGRRREETDRQ